MNEENSIELIRLEQIPVITERVQSVKAQVEQETKAALALLCTEETYKDIKKVRARLNAQRKLLDTQKVQLKRAILKPYEEFERVYDDCITRPFDRADKVLKERIDTVTTTLVDQKKADVMDFLKELLRANNLTWYKPERYKVDANLSVSTKKLKEEAAEFVAKLVAECETIMISEHSAELMQEYRESLNLGMSMLNVSNRHRQMEMIQQEMDNAPPPPELPEICTAPEAVATDETAPAQPEPEPIEIPEPVVEPVPPAPEPVKTYRTQFWVEGSMEQLKALKKFLEDGGYSYGNI